MLRSIDTFALTLEPLVLHFRAPMGEPARQTIAAPQVHQMQVGMIHQEVDDPIVDQPVVVEQLEADPFRSACRPVTQQPVAQRVR